MTLFSEKYYTGFEIIIITITIIIIIIIMIIIIIISTHTLINPKIRNIIVNPKITTLNNFFCCLFIFW